MTVLAFLAMAITQTMTAPDDPHWQVVGRSADSEYAIDPDSIVRRGDRVRVLIRLRTFGAGDGDQTVARYDYDCRANTVRSEAADFYDADGRPAGSVVEGREDVRDVAIAPNSPNALVILYLCSGPAVRVSTLLPRDAS